MRKYTLASPTARNDVDLRQYKTIIEEAVHEIMPQAKVVVTQDCYYVSPSPDPNDARKIGRTICQSELKHYCVLIPKLFTSIKVKEVTYHEQSKTKLSGGHL